MPWLDRQLAELVQAELEAHEVELFPGHAVQRIEAGGSGLICCCDHGKLEADLILAAVGVQPNSEPADAAGLELGTEKNVNPNRDQNRYLDMFKILKSGEGYERHVGYFGVQDSE